jgi:DNA repair photolyase
MKIKFRNTKNIITKSNLPSIDYVINPFIGCQHRCIYCYAEFMIRFTNHRGEKWGEFLDIKTFDLGSIKPLKYNGKRILLSSVTDPYLALEKKYRNTHQILEALIETKAYILVLTKSKLLERDIDLFSQFKNIEVGISICTLDNDFAKLVEPSAFKPVERLKSLQKVYNSGIPTYIFISPFFPEITNYKKIIQESKDFVMRFSFENLNFRPHNITRIMNMIQNHYPPLVSFYNGLKKNRDYWEQLKREIHTYCKSNQLRYQIEFHHGGFSKS